jgi:hypothetical protein
VLPNGTIDAGQGSNNIDATWGTGSGLVKVRALNTCGASSFRNNTFLSVCREEDNKFDAPGLKLEIYPNPAHDKITVSFNSEENENVLIAIIDLSGRTLQTIYHDAGKGLNELMIDLNNYSRGAYLIQIKSDRLNKQLPFILQ